MAGARQNGRASKPDHHLNQACLQELNKTEIFSGPSMDYMMKLFSNELPMGLTILSSRDVDLSYPNYNIQPATQHWIAPVYHKKDGEHWSVVYVSLQRNKGSKPVIQVQHYDPLPDNGRDQDLISKLKYWVEHEHGDGVGFVFIRIRHGPVAKTPFMSGVFAIMAAREFALYQCIQSKSSMWDGEPIKRLKDALQGKSPGLRSDNRQSASTPTAVSPNTSRPKAKSKPKQPLFDRHRGALGSPVDNRRQTMPPAPSTPNRDMELRPKEREDAPHSEPVAQSKREGREDSLTFDVKEKWNSMAMLIENLGIPSVEDLQPGSQLAVVELQIQKRKVNEQKAVDEACVKEHAQRAQELAVHEKEYNMLDSSIAKDQKTLDEYLQAIPEKHPDMSCLKKDKSPAEVLRAFYESDLNASKDELQAKAGTKRKAKEMLMSAEEVCKQRRKEFDVAKKEEKKLEKEARDARRREEMAGLVEGLWATMKRHEMEEKEDEEETDEEEEGEI